MMKIDRNALHGLKFSDPAVLLATWFGVGLMKPAPGTWGTIAGVPFAILIVQFFGWLGLAGATTALFFIGIWVSNSLESKTKSHDNGYIVIDEVVGVWLTMCCVLYFDIAQQPSCFSHPILFILGRSIEPLDIVLSVVFFRFFDILKPWPIGYLDRKISGGLGVMVDDVVAGIFAGLCVIGIHYAGLG